MNTETVLIFFKDGLVVIVWSTCSYTERRTLPCTVLYFKPVKCIYRDNYHKNKSGCIREGWFIEQMKKGMGGRRASKHFLKTSLSLIEVGWASPMFFNS
jgi:hypothetical protein